MKDYNADHLTPCRTNYLPPQPPPKGAMKIEGFKLSEHQATLLWECAHYSISDSCRSFYRLGGHGCVSIRFSRAALPALQKLGLVEYKGYWEATALGREIAKKIEESKSIEQAAERLEG